MNQENEIQFFLIPISQGATPSTLEDGCLTLFSWALCDDHTPRATSPAAFCHNMANFVQNSNFDIARARAEGSSAPAMSKFEF